MSQSKRLLLSCVADLDHVADLSHQGRLILLSFLLEESFQRGIVIEMVLDRVFAFARHDNDVLDAACYALFHHILNLWLIYHREHLFGLRFGRWQEACS